MSKVINTKILIRSDTTSNWTSNNPILGEGQIGFDVTVGKHKIGDGISHWNDLTYFALVTDVSESTKIVSYTAFIGDGTSTSFNITHNLNSRNLLIQCYNTSSTTGNLENIIGYYSIVSNNVVNIQLSEAPAINALKVVIMTTDVLANASGEGGGGSNITYSLSKIGSNIYLNGSDGSSSFVTDDNTTYDLSSYQTQLQVKALIESYLADYGDGDTDTYGGN